jgi:hypothetical protein
LKNENFREVTSLNYVDQHLKSFLFILIFFSFLSLSSFLTFKTIQKSERYNYNKAYNSGKLNQFEAFVDSFCMNSDSWRCDTMRKKIEEVYFDSANTKEEYKEFMKDYCSKNFSKNCEIIKKKIEFLEFKEVDSIGTYASYNAFIDKYPDSDHAKIAKYHLILEEVIITGKWCFHEEEMVWEINKDGTINRKWFKKNMVV